MPAPAQCTLQPQQQQQQQQMVLSLGMHKLGLVPAAPAAIVRRDACCAVLCCAVLCSLHLLGRSVGPAAPVTRVARRGQGPLLLLLRPPGPCAHLAQARSRASMYTASVDLAITYGRLARGQPEEDAMKFLGWYGDHQCTELPWWRRNCRNLLPLPATKEDRRASTNQVAPEPRVPTRLHALPMPSEPWHGRDDVTGFPQWACLGLR